MEAAIGYVRVSSRGQVRGHGIDRQREIIREFAKGAGYRIVEFYTDAHTGAESKRPGFESMVADILSNGVRVILIESLDRLARDLTVQTSLLALLGAHGIKLISATTGEDVTGSLDDPMREAMVIMQGVFAQLDKKLLVRKLAKARAAKRSETGRCEGVKPYGALPGERETLERILDLRRKRRGQRKRLSFASIAERLNADGIPTRNGAPWKPGSIYGIIRRERPHLLKAN